jgi:glycosyltransferase involved in cell wall biosynthesis
MLMAQVSVVIPVFNDEASIAEAIESTQRQQFRPLEIIVVDDGSTDGTKGVVGRCFGPVPVWYYHKRNQGVGVARNLGASLANGDWIAFLDADDTWYANKLAVQCRYIAEHPEAAFVYSDVDLIDDSGNLLRPRWASQEFVYKRPNSRQRLSRQIFYGRPFPLPSTVLMKRALFQRSGGFNSAFCGKYHEDVEFFARLCQIEALHFIDQSLAQHRRHGMQTAASAQWDRRNWLTLLNCLWQLWQNSPRKQAKLTWHYAKHYADLGKYALRSGDYVQARRFCRLAYCYRPLGAANLRHWVLTYLPGLRALYSWRDTKRRPHIDGDGMRRHLRTQCAWPNRDTRES